MNKNRIRHFIQVMLPLLWRIRDVQNDRRMLDDYNKRKAMTQKERESELSKMYGDYIGHELHLQNPTTYTEKIQWRKLYEHDHRMSDLSDKFLVRDWVMKQIGEAYLITCYGIYDRFDQIDFSKLPGRFALKTNHASGWNMIVRDKNKLDYKYAKKKFDLWTSLDYAFVTGFEMQYSGIKPKIVCEKYMEDSTGELKDYKFLCFDGKVMYCWIDEGRSTDHRRNIYDTKWSLQSWRQRCDNLDKDVEKPENFEEMVRIAEVLCKDFAHVRVDLYNVDGRVYFGEMTFTNGSGFEPIIPEEYDYRLGSMWRLSDE